MQLNDSSPQIRLHIVQSLWRIAADGFDAEYDLTFTLETMTTDEDEAVAQAAALAVKDLTRLRNKNEYGVEQTITYGTEDVSQQVDMQHEIQNEEQRR